MKLQAVTKVRLKPYSSHIAPATLNWKNFYLEKETFWRISITISALKKWQSSIPFNKLSFDTALLEYEWAPPRHHIAFIDFFLLETFFYPFQDPSKSITSNLFMQIRGEIPIEPSKFFILPTQWYDITNSKYEAKWYRNVQVCFNTHLLALRLY